MCVVTQTHGSNGAYSSTNLGAQHQQHLLQQQQYSGVSATLPRSQPAMAANYYATAATMQRPLHHQDGPRVSFLPSGNLPLPVALGYTNSSESRDSPTTSPDASEPLAQTGKNKQLLLLFLCALIYVAFYCNIKQTLFFLHFKECTRA